MLNFRLAGINNQNFIMQDRETGSWWQQVTGLAIQGPLKGKQLTRVFHDELTFGAWTGEFPAGRVLVPAGDSAWVRFSEGWEEKTARAPVRIAAALDPRLEPRTIILGIESESGGKAYPLERVLEQAPLHDRVGALPVVLLVGPDGISVRAFEARLAGQAVELVRETDGAAGEFVDVATASRWTFRGEAIAGPLRGSRLPPVYLLKDYWFDWKTYHPNTTVYGLGAAPQ